MNPRITCINSIWTGFVNGLLPALVIAVGVLAFIHMQGAEARSIQFHAPAPQIRTDDALDEGMFAAYNPGSGDITIMFQDKNVLTITKEARKYIASRGQQLEITSLNAPALLRAQKGKK